MPTRNISLTAEQDAFVESLVKTGEYQNASEAVRDALRVLQRRRREDALRVRALRIHIKAGVGAVERGDFIELDDGGLGGYLEGLATTPGSGARWPVWRAFSYRGRHRRTSPKSLLQAPNVGESRPGVAATRHYSRLRCAG